MTHRNAPLTPEGRRRLCERVDAGRAICHVATEAGLARQTVGKWYARSLLEREAGLEDHSSRSLSSSSATSRPRAGWRVHGRGSAQHKATGRAKTAGARAGYVYAHSAVDDHFRLAYSEELLDEKGATAAELWKRAVKFFRHHRITKIRRVLTDNGSCYRSLLFNAALARSRSKHKWTRPYRPQINGKVERYQRTMANEWARSRAWDSNAERAAALQTFLDTYHYARAHTALKGKPPISRLPISVNRLAAWNS
jgi:transposase InsO family protein